MVRRHRRPEGDIYGEWELESVRQARARDPAAPFPSLEQTPLASRTSGQGDRCLPEQDLRGGDPRPLPSSARSSAKKTIHPGPPGVTEAEHPSLLPSQAMAPNSLGLTVEAQRRPFPQAQSPGADEQGKEEG